MAGVRIGGVAALPPACNLIPFSLDFDDGVDQYTSLWAAKHGEAAVELTVTRESQSVNFPQLVDPQVSPDGTQFVYSVIPGSGNFNVVYVVDCNNLSVPVQVAQSRNSNNVSPNLGSEVSMQPTWSPDGTLILYRTTLSASVLNPAPRLASIRTVAPDGTGDALVLSLDMDSATGGEIWWPHYNFDGSRIGMVVGSHNGPGPTMLATCDADGSNFAIIKTLSASLDTTIERTPFSWANTQDVLAYYDAAADTVRLINGDGTGDTLIYTDTDPSWGTMKPTWLLDDSAIVYSQFDSGLSDPKYVIGLLDPGGGGFTALSPSRKWFGTYQNSYPRLFPQDGRIWYQQADPTSLIWVASVLPTGGDYQIEFAPTVNPYAWQGNDGFSYHN